MSLALRILFYAISATVLVACAQPTPQKVTANVNLSGFPPEYKTGYADGCASIKGNEVKDAVRFKKDALYKTG